MVLLFHTGSWTAADLQLAVTAVVAAEIVIISLAALNMSATAVSREREDGTLDIILTTPIQPGPYLAGKLRGLIQFLLPMMAVPFATMLILAIYVMADGFGRQGGVMVTATLGSGSVKLPVVLPEAAIALPAMLVPFVAFCVMVGLHWSIRSKGTISSVIAAVFIVIAVVGVISLCGVAVAGALDVVGGVINTFSPINLLMALVYPANAIPDAMKVPAAGRTSLVIGAFIAAALYAAIVYAMHTNNKRTFMMTVRRLAGQA
jgi:ABC-type transport system involved in multi-copper enzyme maturation permease subunit